MRKLKLRRHHLNALFWISDGFGFDSCCGQDTLKDLLDIKAVHYIKRKPPHKDWLDPNSLHHWKMKTYYDKRDEEVRLTNKGKAIIKAAINAINSVN